MKGFRFPVCVGMASLFCTGCMPDLVVSSFQMTGTPTVNSENAVELPVRAVIKNNGTASADIFKTCTEYTGPQGKYVVAFTVPGQSDIWYPHTSGPLGAGGTVQFDGKVIFHPSTHGVDVTVTATADCCSGDEFMPDYCRVKESDETNNVSSPISVTLP